MVPNLGITNRFSGVCKEPGAVTLPPVILSLRENRKCGRRMLGTLCFEERSPFCKIRVVLKWKCPFSGIQVVEKYEIELDQKSPNYGLGPHPAHHIILSGPQQQHEIFDIFTHCTQFFMALFLCKHHNSLLF